MSSLASKQRNSMMFDQSAQVVPSSSAATASKSSVSDCITDVKIEPSTSSHRPTELRRPSPVTPITRLINEQIKNSTASKSFPPPVTPITQFVNDQMLLASVSSDISPSVSVGLCMTTAPLGSICSNQNVNTTRKTSSRRPSFTPSDMNGSTKSESQKAKPVTPLTRLINDLSNDPSVSLSTSPGSFGQMAAERTKLSLLPKAEDSTTALSHGNINSQCDDSASSSPVTPITKFIEENAQFLEGKKEKPATPITQFIDQDLRQFSKNIPSETPITQYLNQQQKVQQLYSSWSSIAKTTGNANSLGMRKNNINQQSSTLNGTTGSLGMDTSTMQVMSSSKDTTTTSSSSTAANLELFKTAAQSRQFIQTENQALNVAPAAAALGSAINIQNTSSDAVPSKICKISGCHKNSQGGTYCIRHGGGKRCVVDGCNKSVQSKNRCKKHGGGLRCQMDGCDKSSQGKGFCRAHGGGKRCKRDGCTKGTQFGDYCARHGGSRQCKVDGCYRNSRGQGLCASHGGGKRCNLPDCMNPARKNGKCSHHLKLHSN